MLVKFTRNGKGRGDSAVNYLLGKNRDREQAQVLRGDPEQTLQVINSLKFAQNYTSGVLSFEEPDLTKKQKNKIMTLFEKTMFAGMDHDQFEISWIQHKDKGRLELNFLIANCELQTGKRFQPFWHKADKYWVNEFQNMINAGLNLADPHDPARQRNLVTPTNLPKPKAEALQTINAGVSNLIESGQVKNRADVCTQLERAGYEIARKTKSSISLKDPQGGRNIRLKGEYYGAEFNIRNSETVRKSIESRAREYTEKRGQRYKTACEMVRDATEIRAKKHREKFKRPKSPERAFKGGFSANPSLGHNNEFRGQSVAYERLQDTKNNSITRQPERKVHPGHWKPILQSRINFIARIKQYAGIRTNVIRGHRDDNGRSIKTYEQHRIRIKRTEKAKQKIRDEVKRSKKTFSELYGIHGGQTVREESKLLAETNRKNGLARKTRSSRDLQPM